MLATAYKQMEVLPLGAINSAKNILEKFQKYNPAYASNSTDVTLIEKTKQGNQQAFGWLVERYEEKVAATIISMMGDCPEADDVGQETFIKFYNAIHKFRGDSSLGTYLTRIAINLSLNALNSRKRHVSRFLRFGQGHIKDAPTISGDTIVEDKAMQEVVHNAIQSLVPKHKAVVVLRLIEGYSTKEAAKILDLPEGTILSRLARAKEQLKHILEPYI